MQSDITQKNLIRKYINQDCTPGELEEMKKLMRSSEAQRLFDEVLAESWTGLEPEQDIEQPVLNEKLHLFYQRLGAENETAKKPEAEKTQDLQIEDSNHTIIPLVKRRNYLPYAAIITLFIFSLGIYSLIRFKKIKY